MHALHATIQCLRLFESAEGSFFETLFEREFAKIMVFCTVFTRDVDDSSKFMNGGFEGSLGTMLSLHTAAVRTGNIFTVIEASCFKSPVNDCYSMPIENTVQWRSSTNIIRT
jgi:hypothetical protein